MTTLTRRRVLARHAERRRRHRRLPLLNCFLNGNGTALANGAPMPVRFGTWFWGLGMSKIVSCPKKTRRRATICPRRSPR